ncbi:hypothetical protein [Porphyromonas somerae]|uniref:hypothetical protein n=1 Tax=Porphyromonas somerae TaxID=322095 RepID=UPI002A762BFA|nr:hypothetical protein [Porphyromonas somerae]MDY3120032.1 hypothetical protein [Porphyromonas somerae]
MHADNIGKSNGDRRGGGYLIGQGRGVPNRTRAVPNRTSRTGRTGQTSRTAPASYHTSHSSEPPQLATTPATTASHSS